MRIYRFVIVSALISVILAGCVARQAAFNPPQVGSPAAGAAPGIIQSGQSPGPWQFLGDVVNSNNWVKIIDGPANDIWVLDPQGDDILSLTMSGVESSHNIRTSQNQSAAPWGIAVGPDGRMWFADLEGFIDAMTTAGVVSNYPIAGADGAYDIVAGPDGNLWATVFPNQIARISTSGSMTLFNLNGESFPEVITVGPDNNLWFAEYNSMKIGRITTSGVVNDYAIVPAFNPEEIARGNDGNLWFSGHGKNNTIGAMTSTGVMINEFKIPFPNPPGMVNSLGQGPGGDIWFCGFDQVSGYIGRFTRPGKWKLYAMPGTRSAPDQLVVGPDENLWFSNGGRGGVANLGVFGIYLQNVLTVNHSHVTFQPPKPPTRVITVRETPHGGTWTAVSSDTSVVTVAPGPKADQFTLTAVGRGGAIVTVQDTLLNTVTVSVNVLRI